MLGRAGDCRVALFVLAAAVTQSAYAIDPSGEALKVVPAASANGETGDRILEVEGPVFMGDQVVTDSGGQAQILFRDDTKLVVGPNSRMEIDSFVYNPNQTADQVSLRAVEGTFRFITGVSEKQAYSIQTPTMSIGVRGTRFDFVVRPGGETIFALYEGGATLCDNQQRCVDIEGGCNVVVTRPSQGLTGYANQDQRDSALENFFPFARSQTALLPQFQVDTSACRLAAAPFSPPAENLDNDPPDPPDVGDDGPPDDGDVDPDGSDGGDDSGDPGGGSPDGS